LSDKQKKRAWGSGKHNRNSHAWKRYLALSKKVKDAIQEAHRKYFDDILNTSITDNSKTALFGLRFCKSFSTPGDVNSMSVIGGLGVSSISGSCPGGSLVNTEVY
jgi:hypothetical protein